VRVRRGQFRQQARVVAVLVNRGQRLPHVGMRRQRRADLPVRPAFQKRDLPLYHVAPRDAVKQRQQRVTR